MLHGTVYDASTIDIFSAILQNDQNVVRLHAREVKPPVGYKMVAENVTSYFGAWVDGNYAIC